MRRYRMRTRHAPMPPRNLRHNRQPQPAATRQITRPPEALEDVRVLVFAQATPLSSTSSTQVSGSRRTRTVMAAPLPA